MVRKLLFALVIVAFLVLPLAAVADCDYWWQEVSVDIEKDFEFDFDADIHVWGCMSVKGYAQALVKNDQLLSFNDVKNYHNTNSAIIGGGALAGAAGNIAANVVAGDDNAQSNIAAISIAKYYKSMADAEIFSQQEAFLNETSNIGMTNRAVVDGAALSGARGNIAVNVAAGNNNAQSNMLAIAVAPSRVAVASAIVSQKSLFNDTVNKPVAEDFVTYHPVLLGLLAGGTASGTEFTGGYGGGYFGFEGGYISGNVDGTYEGTIWPCLPEDGTIDANLNGGYIGLEGGCEGGQLGGTIGAQQIDLHGVVFGFVPVRTTRYKDTTNTAVLGGCALAGAVGNIGVNIAAGTNNLQANALSVSYVTAPAGPPCAPYHNDF